MSVESIDLRSDTLSRPAPAMVQAMTAAGLGDDRYGESTATRELEEHCAALFGKESGLFLPSATMSNQIALKVLAARGSTVLCETGHHLDQFAAAAGDLAGVTVDAVTTHDGFLRPPAAGPAATGLVWTENTITAHGGRIHPLPLLTSLKAWSSRHGIPVYLDGARIMHAVVATGIAPAAWAATSDAMSLCFTKGLGAPLGSVLLGTADFIRAARRYRLWYGGALHQSGPSAAAALWALRHNSARLAEDHANAALFAAMLAESPHFEVTRPDTNIVHVDVSRLHRAPTEFVARAAETGVRVLAGRGVPAGRAEIRAVFSSGTPRRLAIRAAERLIAVAGQCRPTRTLNLGRVPWWDRIGPSDPVTVSAQAQSRTWR
ncbi:threonine aldolase family protein [Actinoplanes sp. NPDC026670]|uniref:threonine aldolase family protein n=1 Tax=Actinoplanes sp. NPDC026670 TaxID=3154700 RepID=UPI0034046215